MRVGFNTQPPEGGWTKNLTRIITHWLFQHTAARRRLDIPDAQTADISLVSTHSRPKAAGLRAGAAKPDSKRFNTQPPEGGWFDRHANVRAAMVSTHSRPKAAGLEPMPQSPF